MIFKKLFKPLLKPKWQNQNWQERLLAVKELTINDQQQRSIIEQLAFNDNSDQVRLAAVTKLNDFTVWIKALQQDQSNLVRKTAEKQVHAGLFGEADFSVDDTIRQDYIASCNKTQWLEELAIKDQDDNLRLKLLQKLNKPSLLLQSLNNGSDWLKKELIDHIDELAVLEKLRKKATAAVKPLLEIKINQLKLALEKPKLLEQQINLMLAKLNALKDKTDVLDIEARRHQFEQQWEAFKQELSLLDESLQLKLTEKYAKISRTLDYLIIPLKDKWQQQQAELAAHQQQTQNDLEVTQKIDLVKEKLSQSLTKYSDEQHQCLQKELLQIQQYMQGLNLSTDVRQQAIAQIEQLHQDLGRLPHIVQCVDHAGVLLTQFQALPIPKNSTDLAEVEQQYQRLHQDWQTNQAQLDVPLPASIELPYTQLREAWQAEITPILRQQEQQFSAVRKALSELRFLVNNGKYRRAFGLFKKLTGMIDTLTVAHRGRVNREYEALKTKIEDLADWQEYIATPRKQQLLDEITALADDPLKDPHQQAQKVKFIRQVWNSLGRTHDEDDQQLDEQFNQTCERAFEVCRNYYAKQQEIRAANYQAKLDICEQLSEQAKLLEVDPVPWQQVESSVAAARKAFKAAGEVDREKITEVNDKFYGLLKPMQSQLRSYYSQNATLKADLVDKAQALLDHEDLVVAANELKKLQKDWKTVSFAGSKVDADLWKQFRQINDEIFAKRDQYKMEQAQLEDSQLQAIKEQVAEIEQRLIDLDQLAELHQLQQQLQGLRDQVSSLAKPHQGQLYATLDTISQSVQTHRNKIIEMQQKASYLALFEQLEYISNHGELAADIVIDGQWCTLLNSIPDKGDHQQRHDLTIRLEIVGGVSSPEQDSERRKMIQMELLSAKMNGDLLQDKETLLKQWISVGRLAAQELTLLTRVRSLYV